MRRILYLSFILSIFSFTANTQERTEIINAFDDYAKIPREVAYLDLNKSTYIKGEDIGFTAYVFDKNTKKNSFFAKNLYVSIEDEHKNIISKKLLKLENGLASNVFKLDSSFASGYYKIKAYTSWMRNFNQQDYFVESIRIIDPKVEQYIETKEEMSAVDAQFLPESGHLVDQVNNTIGVVLKDQNGYGVSNAKGKVYDKNDILITEFEVNHLGIGRFLLLAERNNSYSVKISHLNKKYSFNIEDSIEPFGVVLNVLESKTNALITISTNKESLDYLKSKAYSLTLHNGVGIYAKDIVFDVSTSITIPYDLRDMPTGLNVFTLFNEKKQPIAERLFFNYNGIDKITSKSVTAKVVRDSINLKIKFADIDPSKFNSLSVSVLPAETECHNRHNNIIASNYLQPYIKGYIENTKYYFTDINSKTKFDMDNLLLTQGWSSYNWYDIFNKPSKFIYPFEQGITIRANVNDKTIKNTEAYMVDITSKAKGLIIKPEENQKSFLLENIFLEEDESIYITEIKKNSNLKVPKLYIQSFPNQIPSLDKDEFALRPKYNYISLAHLKNNEINTQSITDEQKLDEVLIVKERDKARIRAQELNFGRFGNNVEVITDEDRKAFFTFEDYMRSKGVIVNEGRTSVSFNTRRSISPNSSESMDIFIDQGYVGQSIPPRFILMNNIDYVEINKTGLGTEFGTMFKGTGGILRIYTSPKERKKSFQKKNGQKYELPLKFASSKKFYVPKYKYYNDDFYLKYGTIDWKPQISSDADGNFNFSINKPTIPITLFIEGITNDGSFIFEEKTISLN